MGHSEAIQRVKQLHGGEIIILGREPKLIQPTMGTFLETEIQYNDENDFGPNLSISENVVRWNGATVVEDGAVVSAIVQNGTSWYLVKGSTLYIIDSFGQISNTFRLKTNYYQAIVVHGTFVYVYSIDFECTIIDLTENIINLTTVPTSDGIVMLDSTSLTTDYSSRKGFRLYGAIGSHHNIFHILFIINSKTRAITKQIVQLYQGNLTMFVVNDLELCIMGTNYSMWDICYALSVGNCELDWGVLEKRMKELKVESFQIKRLQLMNYIDACIKNIAKQTIQPRINIYDYYFGNLDLASIDATIIKNLATIELFQKYHGNLPTPTIYECILCDEILNFDTNWFETKCSNGHLNSMV